MVSVAQEAVVAMAELVTLPAAAVVTGSFGVWLVLKVTVLRLAVCLEMLLEYFVVLVTVVSVVEEIRLDACSR